MVLINIENNMQYELPANNNTKNSVKMIIKDNSNKGAK